MVRKQKEGQIMDEDSALIKSFLKGNNESFERLIIIHRAKALSFAQRYLHDMYAAEDIVQESFADIYVYRERYKDRYSFKTYLFTIIRNKSVDYIRLFYIVLSVALAYFTSMILTLKRGGSFGLFRKNNKNSTLQC
jgi:RNA polymerase sigma factor (sigma-70 family)